MFYSHTYLRRNGRFGLIWLAATQSKVLSKRELYAVNISMTCSDILNHIPGYVSKEVPQRPRRFSLYLSSQLMYGSAKVLQKQWEYLFLDVSALLRKFHPEVSSDIDLIVLKQDPVTIASCVPTNKDYDPFFGMFKESTVDVEAYLAIWDETYVSQHLLSPSVQEDIESPQTAADRMEIQIRDTHMMPIDQMIPGEQDLPDLDIDNLALLDQEIDISLSVEELRSPQVSRILGITDVTQTQSPHYLHPSLEETPAVRISEEMPRTPQKPKRKRHPDPDERRAKYKDTELEGLVGAAGVSAEMVTPHVETGPDVGVVLPHHHDWLQQHLPIELSPVTPRPTRKRKSSKLIIDQTIQMSREDMKNNMLTSESTSQPMILPRIRQIDYLKEPGSKSLKNTILAKLWTRNCHFGLRIYETDIEGSPSAESITSPLSPVPPRKITRRHAEETGTPIDRMPEKSLSVSVERKRDISAASASFEGEQSLSLIAHISDESQAGLSAKKRRISSESEPSGSEGHSLIQLEQTGELGTLAPWPEEQEHLISPIPLLPLEPELRAAPELTDREASYITGGQMLEEMDTPRTQVLKLVTRNIRTPDDWTTFRTICPPSSYDRIQAARLFMALCCQIGRGNLCVRQDEPYTDIFIWLPAGRQE